jgi:hypothetical protein
LMRNTEFSKVLVVRSFAHLSRFTANTFFRLNHYSYEFVVQGVLHHGGLILLVN